MRGEALLATGRYADAAAEFQKLLSHCGIVGPDPVGTAARLHLGRALALSGDTVKAKSAYAELLTLWKNADRPFASRSGTRGIRATAVNGAGGPKPKTNLV